MGKLQIYIPSDNLNERTYIIQTLIGEFLGLSFELHQSEEFVDYTIQFESRKLIINDAFFHKYKEPLTYLNHDCLPEPLNWLKSSQFFDEELPIIYGNNIIKIDDKIVYVGLDIFASSFFMLARWEETVINEKDKFGRCLESEMYVVKNNLSYRPIVNEYCSFLRNLLEFVKSDIKFLKREFAVSITHDVDYLFRYGSIFSLIQNLGGDIINRKSLIDAGSTISNYLHFRKGEIRDPFDTFDEVMDLSEEKGFKSSFYFKPSIPGEADCTYNIFDKRVIEIITKIHARDHEVGIHPSLNTFHNEKQFDLEVKRIRSLNVPIFGGRQHYLLYDISDSFNFWENSNLEYDSGMGFSSIIGFRCGVCWPFNVFDIMQRKTLKLKEKPLSVMEAALLPMRSEPEIIYNSILIIVNQIKKYSGLFVFLWHNDTFNRPENLKYKEVYKKVIKSVQK